MVGGGGGGGDGEVGGLENFSPGLYFPEKRCRSAERGQRRNRLQNATAAFLGTSRALTRWS